VNKSTDGGKTWDDPVAVVSKDGYLHMLDKPWSAIDPSNPNRIFVSYTDFDYSSSTAACGSNPANNPRMAIEFVESVDGGNTWSAPKVVIAVCGAREVHGSQMAFDSQGTLYISWVNFGDNFPLGPRAIQLSRYKGGILSHPVTVEAHIQPGGDSYFLQGEFRDFLDMAMAVDHSGLASDGTVYIAWSDGRDKIVPDALGIQGAYAYNDELLRVSSDGGRTWGGAPIKINDDAQGTGHDHYQVGIAVDNRGHVGACWYDRREDSENFAIGRYCAESMNLGRSWKNTNIGLPLFAPTHGTDLLVNPIYMGDYDQLTSDFLNQDSGFIGAFEGMGVRGNPDVLAHPMK